MGDADFRDDLSGLPLASSRGVDEVRTGEGLENDTGPANDDDRGRGEGRGEGDLVCAGECGTDKGKLTFSGGGEGDCGDGLGLVLGNGTGKCTTGFGTSRAFIRS